MNEIKTVHDLRRLFESMTDVNSMSLGNRTLAYQRWIEGEALKRYTKKVNEDVSAKKYGIFQNISNWLSIVLISAIVGSIIGAIIGFLLACC